MKRLLDMVASALGLLILSPILAVILFLVWRQDGKSPFYLGVRGARGFFNTHGARGVFHMVKIRSMVQGADKTGVESTGAADARITPLGHFIRRYKLDELTQLWNVLKGDMSLVGPRPNTLRCVDEYSQQEQAIMTLRPGITDLASIVFSDEGDILNEAAAHNPAFAQDPDLAYNQLIRPWKSRLCLLYARHSSVLLDLRIIWLTVLALISKPRALNGIERILIRLNAPPDLVDVARRERPLVATAMTEAFWQ